MVEGTGPCYIGLLPAVLAILGITASLLSTIWCEAVQFKPDMSGLPSDIPVDDKAFATLRFGLYYYGKIAEYEESETNTFEDLVAVTDTCVYYSSNVDMDAAWKAARAFAIIAPAFAGLLTFFLIMSPCCVFWNRTPWQKMALCFIVIAPAFQSLTLLMLTSDVCKNNPVIESSLGQLIKTLGMVGLDDTTTASEESAAETDLGNSTSTTTTANAEEAGDESSGTLVGPDGETALLSIYGDKCEWDWGTYANLVSMGLFVVTGIVMLMMGPPTRPPPKEPQVQTVTYEQKTNEGGQMEVQEVDVVSGPAKSDIPHWANPAHPSPIPSPQLEHAKPY